MLSFHEYYTVGQTLPLTRLPHKCDLSSPTILVRIRELKGRTMSCTMVVDIEADMGTDANTDTRSDTQNSTQDDTQSDEPAMKTGFLKLYDRRFADQLREDGGVGTWTPTIEDAYMESIRTGSIQQFAHDLRHVEDFLDNQDNLGEAQSEACLNNTLLEDYAAEIAVYDALRDHQGTVVPRLLAAVDLDFTPLGAKDDELFHVKGILLEFIESFPMSEFPTKTPQSAWQSIVDQALAAIHVLDDHYILDVDRHTQNFVVAPDKEKDGEFRVFMVDFGSAEFKREDESEEEWASNKITKGEETRVGTLWKRWLADDYGFHLSYKPSERYYAAGLEFARALARVDLERYEKRKTEAMEARAIAKEKTFT